MTCASACGEVRNNCGTLVSCGCGARQVCCAGTCQTLVWDHQTNFGADGSGLGQFRYPSGVTRSTDGLTVWVVDYLNHRISVWTRPGTSSTAWTNQTTFGTNGPEPAQFESPYGVAVSADALTAWVADTGNDRISVWGRPNTSSTAWANLTTFGSFGADPNKFVSPYDVALSADELTLWVADANNQRVSVWTRPSATSAAWTNQTTFGTSGTGPTNLSFPTSVTRSDDGLTVWVADNHNHRVSIWTRPSASSTAWTNQTTFGTSGSGPNQFNNPSSVAVSADELTAWVMDYGNDRISVWGRPNTTSTAWENLTTFGSQGSGAAQFWDARGVEVSADGLTAWVADTNNQRISVWTAICPV